MEVERVLDSLRRAVAVLPDDHVLRHHLAELLLAAGLRDEALRHLGRLLVADPGNPEHEALMARATAAGAPVSEPDDSIHPASDGFDWGAAEQDLEAGLVHEPVVTRLRLADVGGLADVKAQIESTFLTPLRNPELRARFGATMRGGLLLYGPPGCGKTHLARAVAGELGAGFVPVGLTDVLSKWVGESEANLAGLFARARSQAPCVVFLDELDALGHARAALGSGAAALRGVVNQLLVELDGVTTSNDGLFVLGATNAPWDVDLALRRPGRFDRTVFVGPPDAPARAHILATELSVLPVEPGLDLNPLVARTEGFSGADLALACRTAGQLALADAVRSGATDRAVGAGDLVRAIEGIRPSPRTWFDSARNVVMFADTGGEFAALAAFMRAHRLL